jgi:hypothetical protein
MQLGKYSALAGLAGAFTLVYIAQKAVEYQLSFYVYEKFNWSMTSVGILGIFIGVLLIGIQGGLIRYLIPKWGLKKNIIIGPHILWRGANPDSLCQPGLAGVCLYGALLFRRDLGAGFAGLYHQ